MYIGLMKSVILHVSRQFYSISPAFPEGIPARSRILSPPQCHGRDRVANVSIYILYRLLSKEEESQRKRSIFQFETSTFITSLCPSPSLFAFLLFPPHEILLLAPLSLCNCRKISEKLRKCSCKTEK